MKTYMPAPEPCKSGAALGTQAELQQLPKAKPVPKSSLARGK